MSDEQALTDWQKAKLLGVMRLGADRATACHYVGIGEGQLQAALAASEEFARDVLQAEAQPEVTHLGNIHRASQEEKNWRTSAWWLERRGPGRVGAAIAAQALARLSELVDILAGIIAEEITEEAQQRRLIERLLAAVHGIDESEPDVITEVKLLPAATPEAAPSEAESPQLLALESPIVSIDEEGAA
jgi:hypothetical protein